MTSSERHQGKSGKLLILFVNECLDIFDSVAFGDGDVMFLPQTGDLPATLDVLEASDYQSMLLVYMDPELSCGRAIVRGIPAREWAEGWIAEVQKLDEFRVRVLGRCHIIGLEALIALKKLIGEKSVNMRLGGFEALELPHVEALPELVRHLARSYVVGDSTLDAQRRTLELSFPFMKISAALAASAEIDSVDVTEIWQQYSNHIEHSESRERGNNMGKSSGNKEDLSFQLELANLQIAQLEQELETTLATPRRGGMNRSSGDTSDSESELDEIQLSANQFVSWATRNLHPRPSNMSFARWFGQREKLVSVYMREIKKGDCFDAVWYAEQYPDVKKAKISPLEHYVRFGAAEGRNPSGEFNTFFYLNNNPDVVDSGLNPLFHYSMHGKNEGRATR